MGLYGAHCKTIRTIIHVHSHSTLKISITTHQIAPTSQRPGAHGYADLEVQFPVDHTLLVAVSAADGLFETVVGFLPVYQCWRQGQFLGTQPVLKKSVSLSSHAKKI